MIIIKYNLCSCVNGAEVFSPVTLGWNEVNEEIAKREAYNGEYTIEDNGLDAQPTDEERIAQLEEALELLLSGVTE
jgi:hypothetical protein